MILDEEKRIMRTKLEEKERIMRMKLKIRTISNTSTYTS